MELMTQLEKVRIETDEDEWQAALWLPDEATALVVLAGENAAQRARGAAEFLPAVLRDARLGILAYDAYDVRHVPARAGGAGAAGISGASSAAEAARKRLRAVCAWVQNRAPLNEMPLGLIATGAGAAAALHVAAELGRRVCALVARGPQPDARGFPDLHKVSAPTLLIAGSLDERAVEASRQAYTLLRCKKRFEIVPGATRAFDEPGSFEVLARLARSWLTQHVHQQPYQWRQQQSGRSHRSQQQHQPIQPFQQH